MITKMAALVEELKINLRLANIKLFGQSSEQSKYIEFLENKVNAKLADIKNNQGKIQLDLFTDILEDIKKLENEAQKVNAAEKPAIDDSQAETKQNQKPKTIQLADVEHLEHVECHHGEDLKECPNCHSTALNAMGAETTKELEIIPAKIIIKEHITHKFICNQCRTITRGHKPQSPLPKCMAGPNLLAHICHNRFDLFIPYYRMSRDFLSYGLKISDVNLCNWTNNLAEDIFPVLYDALKKDVLSSDVIYCDETTIDELAKGKCKKKYLWCYTNNKTKNMVFHYSSRHRENPTNFLFEFKNGYLITDKYSGYNEICKKHNIKRSYCWAHARRKFHELIKGSSDPNNLKEINLFFLSINEILKTDAEIRKGIYGEILSRREAEVRPLIDELFKKLEVYLASDPLLPKSVVNAIEYLLKDPEEFKTFLLHPDIEPTNNISERNIRFITIGRNNWLFAGSERGGRTTAIVSSIVASARAHHLNTIDYLNHIIQNLPNAKMSEVASFLPQNCLQFQAKSNTKIESQEKTLNI